MKKSFELLKRSSTSLKIIANSAIRHRAYDILLVQLSVAIMCPSCTVSEISLFYEIDHSKITQGHRQCRPSIERLDFLSETWKVDYTLIVRQTQLKWRSRSLAMAQFNRQHVTFLHRFRDINTCLTYVIACNREQSFRAITTNNRPVIANIRCYIRP